MSAFGAVAVTVTSGFVGAWIQSRREHHRWIRERRYEAYVAFLSAADKWAIRMSEPNQDKEAPEFYDEMVRGETAVDLIGSDEVRAAMEPVRAKILGWNNSRGYAGEYWAIQRQFVLIARTHIHNQNRQLLGIPTLRTLLRRFDR